MPTPDGLSSIIIDVEPDPAGWLTPEQVAEEFDRWKASKRQPEPQTQRDDER